MCVWVLGGKSDCEKAQLYVKMAFKWDLQNPGERIFGMGDFIGHVERRIDDFESVHGGYRNGERNAEESLLDIEMKSCLWQTHGFKRRYRGK